MVIIRRLIQINWFNILLFKCYKVWSLSCTIACHFTASLDVWNMQSHSSALFKTKKIKSQFSFLILKFAAKAELQKVSFKIDFWVLVLTRYIYLSSKREFI